MGKTKQASIGKTVAAKKFDRNVEISAPILDPEVIRAIHSPPKDKKLDIRHGGFKALLSDLNSQDSMDEPTPITENHLPSYIGISCAVSGYSSYSSYNRRPLEEMIIGNGGNNDTTTTTKAARLTTSGSRLSATPNRSRTGSPMMHGKQRAANEQQQQQQQHITHVTIDRSTMGSADQERKELTEKLTASATERRRAPSPLPPPIEDGRHHGAYVGARYFPMPEPSKIVHKHIPLLGIDDDQDPDEFVAEDTNKVEKQIANLYGEEFVEDWKESMSHKAKKELPEGEETEAEKSSSSKAKNMNLKDLVTLKPTPPHVAPQVAEPPNVPTPDVKVLAGVEQQFLNRLLTDENPPMPRTPSPQPMSPVSPRFSRPIVSPTSTNIHQHQTTTTTTTTTAESQQQLKRSPTSAPPPPPTTKAREPTPEPIREPSPEPIREPTPELSPVLSPVASPSPIASPSPVPIETEAHEEMAVISEQNREMSPTSPASSPTFEAQTRDSSLVQQRSSTPDLPRDSPVSNGGARTTGSLVRLASETIVEEVEPAATMRLDDEIITLDEQLNASLDGRNSQTSARVELPVSPSSPDSVRSSSTVEEVGQRSQVAGDHHQAPEEHIEYEIRANSPMDNESSPVRILNIEPALEHIGESQKTQEAEANLVSFSPEPAAAAALVDVISSESGNNINHDDLMSGLDGAIPEGGDSDLLQAVAVEPAAVDETPVVAAQTTNSAESADKLEEAAHVVESAAAATGAIRDGRYFLSILEQEESFIMDRVRIAEANLAEHETDWNEETIGKVRSAIGKAHLLINKKCNQFRELCEKSLVNDASDQYAVLNDDLAGFWDMISIQIADVKKSFETL